MPFQRGKKSKEKDNFKWIVFAVVLVLFTLYKLNGFITDYLWFKEVGYTSVFWTELGTKLKIGVPMFFVLAIIAFIFLTFIKKSFLKKGERELKSADSPTAIRNVSIMLSLIFSAIITIMTAYGTWFQALQFINAADFGTMDPLFGKDIGFYLFKLEFLNLIGNYARTLVLGLLGISAVLYMTLVSHTKVDEPKEPEIPEFDAADDDSRQEAPFRRRRQSPMDEIFRKILQMQGHHGEPEHGEPGHKETRGEEDIKVALSIVPMQMTILAVLFFLITAFSYYLKRFDVMYGASGVVYGAGYSDIMVTLNTYKILMVLALICVVAVPIGIKKRNVKLALVLPSIMILLSLASAGAIGLVQEIVVRPDEINKEAKYLENNIKYTRMAYGLQDISIRDFSPKSNLTRTDVLKNMGTFSNIRINDFEQAEQFYNQTQSIRTYYDFNDVDVDRYYVNGEYTQVFLSAREIDQTKIDNQWLVRHLKYTHGYGITLSRVDKVTESGQPDMLIDSIPPVSQVEEIEITRPEIYFGEKTDGYVIVKTDEEEFDYPSGETNMYNMYEGKAGIELGIFSRILFALREGDIQMLVSTNINSDSRILIYRNISQRVRKIAPFFAYDDDPYVVTEGGKIYWILDAYTMSDHFPYSEPWNPDLGMNYIRNSVKIVVDAYDGTVDFYLIDDSDPIALTLAGIYPDLLKPFSDMPEGLKSHIQYPNALFNIQADVYKKYHMTDVDVFYQNEDLWAISNETYGQAEKQMIPNFFIMKLPGEDKVEFINSIPYTPHGKANMTGILMARNDGNAYGELILYRMPKDRIIYGPAQIEAQINQDTEISKEFALWNNSGSTYTRGNMFVFPVEDSLVYIEPVYLEASHGSLPEVKRVIVYYGDKIAYSPTLAEALNKMFGEGAGEPLKEDNPIAAGMEAAAIIEAGGIYPVPPGGTPFPEDETPKPPAEETPEPEDPTSLNMEELARLASEAYEKALLAQKNGEWAAYGGYLKELEKYLKLMTK